MSKYVLISGANGGLGKATAIALAARGFTVLAADLERTQAAMQQWANERIIPIALDLTSIDSINACIATVKRHIGMDGHLTALVNNAGVDYNAPLATLEVAEIQAMINVNLLGSILMTRAALPLMQRGQSRIVFVGSAMGLFATPTVTVYSSTKWALEGLSDALRVELGMLGIHVVLVEPGVVQTPMAQDAPAVLERMLTRMDTAQRTLYEPLMRAIAAASSKKNAGISAPDCAAVIERAVTAESPKSRYRAGADASAVGVLRHLPDALKDFIVRKTFGIRA